MATTQQWRDTINRVNRLREKRKKVKSRVIKSKPVTGRLDKVVVTEAKWADELF